ncbi:MAG: hypothetical protein DCC51_14405, partial [Anaerolineae bacterium]
MLIAHPQPPRDEHRRDGNKHGRAQDETIIPVAPTDDGQKTKAVEQQQDARVLAQRRQADGQAEQDEARGSPRSIRSGATCRVRRRLVLA